MMDNSINEIEDELENWHPRELLSRTSWLYRVDALWPHDRREMSVLWDLAELFRGYATQFITWAYTIRSVIGRTTDTHYIQRMEFIIKVITNMVELFWSEDYYYFFFTSDVLPRSKQNNF